jgi:drug/metabolite transporter (DMT)-like permease
MASKHKLQFKELSMKYKILGATLAFAGLILITKFQLHLIGLILIIVGVYLAITKGMRLN